MFGRRQPVVKTVDQQDGRGGSGNSRFWRRLAKVQTVLPTGVEEASPNGRLRQNSADLGRKWKPLGHAILGDSFKAGVWAVGNNGIEATLDCKRLDEHRAA